MDVRGSATWWLKIYFNFMNPTQILNWLNMKVAFTIYVSLSGTIGVIFATVINNLLRIRRILVKCLFLWEGTATKWSSGSWRKMRKCPTFFTRTALSRRDTQFNRIKEVQTFWWIDQGDMGNIGKSTANFFQYQKRNRIWGILWWWWVGSNDRRYRGICRCGW